jgi:glucose/arabinose dehydrogenase
MLTFSVLPGGLMAALPLDTLKLPEGFAITLFSDQVPNARQMVWGAKGTLFVGSKQAGNLYALRDEDGDGKAEKRWLLAEGLDQPSGIAFDGGSLYVAALNRIYRFPDIEARLDNPAKVLLTDKLPGERHHGWKYLGVGPDRKLYFNIGAPCNVCLRGDSRFATISRMDLSGKNVEVFAQGVRNSVGFDWNPQSQVLWFTDNGRDFMGNNTPPDELNRALGAGFHYGFPFNHAGITDLSFPFSGWLNFTQPALKLPAHVAPLGITFYRGRQFPSAYRNDLFIAEHGSWNRSVKVGYRVTRVTVRNGRAVHYEPFVTGWLQGDQAWGRPADVEMMPDGSLLIADDLAGVIYRVSYGH